MSNDPYILITADTHAGGNHAAYREFLDPAYREEFDAWRAQYRNPSVEHYGTKKQKNWDFAIRSADQNSQGVVGEVIFPNTVLPFSRTDMTRVPPPRPEEYRRALAAVRAHNRWLEAFCAEDPLRRAGIGVILPNDLDEAVKDIEFIAKAGLRGGVLLPLIPPDCTWLKPIFDPAWDRVFAAIQDHDLVLNQHTGQGLPYYYYSQEAETPGPVGLAVWITEVLHYGQAGFRHMLLSGAYEKFPKLKYILTEAGCSWVPDVLAGLDRAHKSFVSGSQGEITYQGLDWPLKKLPSEYAAEHCYYGASFPSLPDLDGIDAIGEDHVLWGNDYPHYEGTYPYTLESLRLTFAGVAEGRRRKVLGLNAAKLYKFDLEKLKPLAEKYGPTPAQINAPLPTAEIPADATCYLFKNALAAA